MKRFAVGLFGIGVLSLLICVAHFSYKTSELKSGDFIYKPYHSNGQRFSRHIGPSQRLTTWTSLAEVSEPCQHIIVEAEDLAFYEHHGVVFGNMLIAAQINWRNRKIVFGASTITQQLAKNLFLSRDKTLIRKGLEVIAALVLDATLSKKEQLEFYLNAVEFGPDLYGIGDAAQAYFKKNVNDLNVFECGVLAAILPFPLRHFAQLSRGSFDAAVAKDLSPMMQAYSRINSERGPALLSLLERAVKTKRLRNLNHQIDKG